MKISSTKFEQDQDEQINQDQYDDYIQIEQMLSKRQAIENKMKAKGTIGSIDVQDDEDMPQIEEVE